MTGYLSITAGVSDDSLAHRDIKLSASDIHQLLLPSIKEPD